MMGGFATGRDLAGSDEDSGGVGWSEPVGAMEAARRGFQASFDVWRVGAREEAARADLWQRQLEIEKRLGKTIARSRFMTQGSEVFNPTLGEWVDTADMRGDRDWAEADQLSAGDYAAGLDDTAYEARIDALRKEHPDLMAGIPTRVELDAARAKRLSGIVAAADEAGRQHPIAGFAGSAAGTLVDPVNVLATLYTGGAGAGRGLLLRVGEQALANALVEGAQQPFKAADAARFGGPDWTPGQAVSDVVGAGVGAGAFELGGTAVKKVAGAAWRKAFGSPDPSIRGAAHVKDTAARDEAMLGGLEGEDFDTALDALESGRPPPPLEPAEDVTRIFGDQPPVAVTADAGAVAVTGQRDYRGRRIYAASFDPMALEVAPKTFQYKADGDAQGVTARLRGVEAWDDGASGKIMVWEARDGRMVVADGHQRRGLARRMSDKGFDVRLDGMLFREVDGWGARDVRVLAALKNIREGSGTILDAAKVFRDAPDALTDRSLPLTGDFMAQARGLAKLDKGAFGAVVNKVIPEAYGAQVGLLAPHRPDLHDAMVKLLHEGEPGNLDEARAMIVEAMQDDWIRAEGETGDLFGYDPAVSAMATRAKVAAAVKRALARDERLLAQLVKHADAIEAGGNALAREANEAALAVDKAALEMVSKLALRHGPIGEAMAEAAGKVARGQATPADASKGIVQMVRNAIAAGERLDDTRGVSLAPDAPTPAAGELVAGFDEAGGKAASDQTAFAPEDADLADTPGLFDDLMETGAEERAHARLIQCVPGDMG